MAATAIWLQVPLLAHDRIFTERSTASAQLRGMISSLRHSHQDACLPFRARWATLLPGWAAR